MTYPHNYYVYILTNEYNTVLYVGITNNLIRRISEHRAGSGSQFTGRYKIHKLVYYESSPDVTSAISREKQLKGGSRQKKIDLILSQNPDWKDLFEEISG